MMEATPKMPREMVRAVRIEWWVSLVAPRRWRMRLWGWMMRTGEKRLCGMKFAPAYVHGKGWLWCPEVHRAMLDKHPTDEDYKKMLADLDADNADLKIALYKATGEAWISQRTGGRRW